MKRKLLSLACCSAFGGMAHAQSVTVYGVLDTGIGMQSTTATSYANLNAALNTKDKGRVLKMIDGGIGASNFGFRGVEDLGDGLKASFQLQGNFSTKTGAGSATGGGGAGFPGTPTATLFNQIATVGLSGRFGEVKLGRQVGPLYYNIAATDPREGRYFGSMLGALVGVNSSTGKWSGFSTNAPLGAVYDDNAIVYNSPSFGGLKASLEYVVGEVGGNTSAASREAIALMYERNGLKIGGVYYNAHDANTAAAAANGTTNNRWVSVGGKYTASGMTFSGGYAIAKNPSNPTAADYRILSAGFGYQFSPVVRLTSGLYKLKDNNSDANKSLLYSVGVDYSLSKRTTLYVEGGSVNNEGNMNQGLFYGSPVAGGVRTNAFAVGVRHSF